MTRQISNRALVDAWLATANPDRREGMLAWLQLVAIDPEYVTDGWLIRQGQRRKLSYSDVPRAQTRVLFIVADAPARVVHVVNIDDESFGMTTEP